MQVEVTTVVEVDDTALLRLKAEHINIAQTGGRSDLGFTDEKLGTFESPDMHGCLKDIASGVFESDSGVRVLDVRSKASGPLRVIPMVAASISNLTVEEMDRIREAFQLEEHGRSYKALEDVQHDGLWLSPKDHGFYVRLPALAERWDEILPGLTPEMRAIVELARAQGADRIEFDADEDATDGLADFSE
jgi:hypothetical protein